MPRISGPKAKILNLFCVMNLFESLVKPTDSSSEQWVLMHKIEILTFTEVNKYF